MKLIKLLFTILMILGGYYATIWISNIFFTIINLNVIENLIFGAILPSWLSFLIQAILTVPATVYILAGGIIGLEKILLDGWDGQAKITYIIITLLVLISCEIRLTEHLPGFLENIGTFFHDKCKMMVWRPLSRIGLEDGFGTELTLFDISLGISFIITLLSAGYSTSGRDVHSDFYDELHTSW